MPIGILFANPKQNLSNVLKQGPDALTNERRPLSGSQEAGETGDDARGGVGPRLLQRVLKQLQGTTGKNLSILQGDIGTTGILSDVTTNTGIANQRETASLRHRGRREKEWTKQEAGNRKLVMIFILNLERSFSTQLFCFLPFL